MITSFFKRYVDDTFVIWPHGRKRLDDFFEYLNSLHPSIKFTMEIEHNDTLPFLDVLITKNNNTLSHTTYRKKTHTNRYLHATSHHAPSQIQSVASSLIDRSNKLADDDHRSREMSVIRNVLSNNGFTKKQIDKAQQRAVETPRTNDHDTRQYVGTCTLPYIKGVTDKLGRLLRNNNIRTVFNTERKISNILTLPTDRTPNQHQGVYEISCLECDQIYIGKTNRRVECRVSEHKVDVRNKKPSSALAFHTMTENHTIDFDSAKTLVKSNKEHHRTLHEAINIAKRDHAMNHRDDTSLLPSAYHHLIKKIGPTQYSSKNDLIITPTNPSVSMAQSTVILPTPAHTRVLRPRK